MGPTGSGKSALAMALAERFNGRNRQRGFGAGLSRDGHRHGEARRLGTRAECATTSSISSIRSTRIRRRAFAPMRWTRSPPSGRGVRFRCWSAARCSTSRRCATACRRCPPPIPRYARASTRGRQPKGGPRSTPSSRESIPSPPRDSKPMDAQRIQRALEVHEISGRPLSQLQGAREAGGGPGPDDRGCAHAVGSRRVAPGDRRAIRRDARGRSRGRGRGTARAPCADTGHAVDALRRLPPGVGVSRRRDRCRDAPRERQLRRRGNWRSASTRGSGRRRRRRSNLRRRSVADRVADFLAREGLPRA